METFIIPGEPAPWTAQMRKAQRSEAFVRMQVYQAQIQAYIRRQWAGRDMIAGPIYLEMEFYRGTPFYIGQSERFEWQLKNIQNPPDRGNYFKAAEDALQGILFKNDGQVISDKAFKWYTDDLTGFTVIRIRSLTETETIFGTRIGWARMNK